jgi:tetratricopeptide (TPR) repeat protein
MVLSGRASARARMGRWKEAAADYSRLVDFEPQNSMAYHALASLLVQSGDLRGYRLHSAQELARFAGTTDPYIAHHMAKDCLILPDSGVDLSAVGAWADTAVTAGKDNGWFQICKGLAEYRQGKFVSAADWMQKGLTQSVGEPDEGDLQAYMVLAMAQYRSKHTAEASAALAKGVEIETKLPKLDSGDFGLRWRWIDWIIAQALMREAKALIEGPRAAATEQKSEPR